MDGTLLSSLEAFAEDKNPKVLDAAFLVAQCLDESLSIAPIKASLDRLAEAYREEARRTEHESSATWQFLRRQGFGDGGQIEVVAGSRIDNLLEGKRGLPITQGILLIHLSEAAGQTALGINFPGHFLVRVEQTLVDPFHMRETTELQCLAMLPAELARQLAAGEAFAAADAVAIALRMFNNLKFHFVNQAQFHRALDLIECQLCLAPGNVGLLFEQGEFWLRLGSIQGARTAFEQVLRAGAPATDSDLAVLAKQRLEELSNRSDTLH